jgi:hypothetical protein
VALVPPGFDIFFGYILFSKHLTSVAARPSSQMFDNAQKYNSPDTIFYKTAKSMQEASRKMIDSARGTLGECALFKKVQPQFGTACIGTSPQALCL